MIQDSTASAVAGDHDLVFSIMRCAFPADVSPLVSLSSILTPHDQRWSLRSRLEWVREQNVARYKHLFCPKMELFVDRMRPARAADQIMECQSLHFAVPGNIDIATTVATGALLCRPSCACQAPRGSQSAEEQNSFVLVSSNTEEAPPCCESQGHGSSGIDLLACCVLVTQWFRFRRKQMLGEVGWGLLDCSISFWNVRT